MDSPSFLEGLPISIVDIVVIVVLLISALVAAALGFVRTLLLFAAWGLAVYAAMRAWPIVQTWDEVPPIFSGITSSMLLAQVITIVAVFTGVLVVFWIVGFFLSRLVRRSPLRGLDKLLGLLLGFGLGGTILCMAYLIIDRGLPEADRPIWFTTARSLPYLKEGAAYLQTLLPPSVLPQRPGEDPAPVTLPGYTEQQRGAMDQAIQDSQSPPPQEP